MSKYLLSSQQQQQKKKSCSSKTNEQLISLNNNNDDHNYDSENGSFSSQHTPPNRFVYDLFAVCNHKGQNMANGHYTGTFVVDFLSFIGVNSLNFFSMPFLCKLTVKIQWTHVGTTLTTPTVCRSLTRPT
jgi:hypothetical protein